MTFLKLAPFAQSYDFWIAVFFCIFASFIWLFIAWKASRSGSIIRTFIRNKPIDTPSDENIPIYKSAWFWFFVLHFVLGNLFFWAMLWPDYKDVWFI